MKLHLCSTLIYSHNCNNQNIEFRHYNYDLKRKNKWGIQYSPLILLFNQVGLTFPKPTKIQIGNQKKVEEF